jgi:hypothetical protein
VDTIKQTPCTTSQTIGNSDDEQKHVSAKTCMRCFNGSDVLCGLRRLVFGLWPVFAGLWPWVFGLPLFFGRLVFAHANPLAHVRMCTHERRFALARTRTCTCMNVCARKHVAPTKETNLSTVLTSEKNRLSVQHVFVAPSMVLSHLSFEPSIYYPPCSNEKMKLLLSRTHLCMDAGYISWHLHVCWDGK